MDNLEEPRHDDLISVVVPVYNNQRYLSQCLDSVLAQQRAHLEVLVVNDGSTDCSPELARAYEASDKRVRVVDRPNGGAAAARNTGLDLARGTYVTFVDADDLLLPGALEQLLSMMTPSTDITAGRYYRGVVRGSYRELPQAPAHKVVTGSYAARMMLYHREIRPTVCGRLYRRSAIGRTRFVEGTQCGDPEFFFRLLMNVRDVAYTRRYVYFYRYNAEGVTGREAAHSEEMLRAATAIERESAELGLPELAQAARTMRFYTSMEALGTLQHAGDGSAAKQCREDIKRLRSTTLHDPQAHALHRLGALLSYLGPQVSAAWGKLLRRPRHGKG